MVSSSYAPAFDRNSGASSVPVILRAITVPSPIGPSEVIVNAIGCDCSAAIVRSRAAIMSRWMKSSDATVKSHATTRSLAGKPAVASAARTSAYLGRIASSSALFVGLPSTSAVKPGGTTRSLPSAALTFFVIATA